MARSSGVAALQVETRRYGRMLVAGRGNQPAAVCSGWRCFVIFVQTCSPEVVFM